MGENFLNEEQAARVLNASKRTLQGWRQRGDGPPYVKVGHLVRYQPSSLEAYFVARTRHSTSDTSEAA